MTNGIPGSDVRSAAVPAALDVIVTLLSLYGTKSFEAAVQPTLEILDAGGPTWYIDTSVALIKQVLPNAKSVGTVYNQAEPQSRDALAALQSLGKREARARLDAAI